MSVAVAWAALGAAVLVVPVRVARRSTAPRRRPGDRRPASGVASKSGGPIVAAATVGAACVALFGITRGAVAGMPAAIAAWATLRWLQSRPVRADADPRLPLVLDLVAAALRAGQPLAVALARAAGAARADVAADLAQVSGLCRLGADPAHAWSMVARDGPLAAVGPVAVRSARSGIKIATAFERLAAELRAEQAARRAARAHRAGVTALGPLAACFLPAFLCLGVVPVIAGIASTALGVLPGGG